MKILIVSPGFWPESFRINDVVADLVKRGHQVDVLAGHPHYPGGRYFEGYSWWGPFQEDYLGARILRFPQIPRGKGRKWELLLQYGSFVLFGFLRLLFVGRWSWDVVLVFQSTPVTSALPGLLARSLAGARSVIWVQDLWPDVMRDAGINLPPAFEPFVGWLSRGIYKSFNRVLTQNESMIPSLVAVGVPRKRLENVYNWADDAFERIPSSLPNHGEFIVMVAGNLGRVQAIPTVLNAARRLKDLPGIKWVLVGNGPMVPFARERVLAWGLTGIVELPGYQPPGDMPDWYNRADAMLLSLNRGEFLAKVVPTRLQGYFAAGRPVLVSGDGESARIVEDAGAGFAAPAEDDEGLAKIVLRLSNLPLAERRQMAEQARQYYENTFTKSSCMKKLETALLEE